jgi:hypothetical protein
VLVNADWNLIVRIAAPCGMMDPRDVAKAIASLASDDAVAIHSAVYRVERQGRRVANGRRSPFPAGLM